MKAILFIRLFNINFDRIVTEHFRVNDLGFIITEDDTAVCIVTHIAGGEDTYYGYAYYEEDGLDW